jgi:4'-phosphopantetheinyl transferase EntD
MYTWKLTNTLANPLDPEWQSLLEMTLGDTVHVDRKNGFLLSREALQSCLKEKGLTVSPRKLMLENFHKINGLNQFTISLSHTKECGAALLADSSIFRTVGIDIEHEERLVKDSIRERIENRSDATLRNIELWCIKEAVFKALMNTDQFEKPIEFSSIEIHKNYWTHSPSGLKGEWEIETKKPYLVARAFLKA